MDSDNNDLIDDVFRHLDLKEIYEYLKVSNASETLYDNMRLFDYLSFFRVTNDCYDAIEPFRALRLFLNKKDLTLSSYDILALYIHMTNYDDMDQFDHVLDKKTLGRVSHMMYNVIPELERAWKDVDKYLESHDINSDIIYDDIRLFDYMLVFHYYQMDHVIDKFLCKEDLIISPKNLLILEHYIQSYPQNVYSFPNKQFETFKLIVNNKSVKKLEYFKLMLHFQMNIAVQYKDSEKIMYILSIPEYDMEINVNVTSLICDVLSKYEYPRNKLCNNHPIMGMDDTVDDDKDDEYSEKFVILSAILKHPTFELFEECLEIIRSLPETDKARMMIEEYIISHESKIENSVVKTGKLYDFFDMMVNMMTYCFNWN